MSTTPAEPATSSLPQTLYRRLSESSHPVALLSFLILRLSPIAIYLFGSLFSSNYILLFITVILLLAADFWNVKNISGRLLVGLRWWNESNELGQSIWVFENADPNRYINPVDSKVFWALMYIVPAVWTFLAILALLKLELLSLILVIVSISLSLTNTMAYTKCDKFGKANNIANNVLSSVGGSLFSGLPGLNVFSGLFGASPAAATAAEAAA